VSKFRKSSLALMALIAGPAAAADLPAESVYKAPSVAAAPLPSWTGFYLGLGLGTRSSVVDTALTAASDSGLAPFSDLMGASYCNAQSPCTSGEPVDSLAFRLSPYAGYNWQMGAQWLVGLEGDFGWAKGGRTLSGMFVPGGAASNNLFSGYAWDSYAVNTTWDASLRGRLGWLPSPTLLLYATGGATWLHVEQASVCSGSPLGVGNPGLCLAGFFAPGPIVDATTRTGWTVGAGLEALVWDHWVARAEYRYADYGTWSPTDTRTFTFPGSPTTFLTTTTDVHLHTHTATFGMAYTFGDGSRLSADTPAGAPMYVKAPLAAPAPWTGPYVGLGLGTRTSVVDTTLIAATDTGAFDPNLLDPSGSCTSTALCIPGQPLDSTALRLSPYLGFDWQSAPQWLMGLEGDWGWAKSGRSVSGMFVPGTNSLTALVNGRPENSYTVDTGWDASLRARVGWLPSPALLLYTTGGAAWLSVEQASVCGAVPQSFFNNRDYCGPLLFGRMYGPSAISDTTVRAGWTVGGGLEAMLWDHWMARGEYRYADFGTWSPTDVRTCSPTCAATALTTTTDIRIRTHTATLGLAYKF